MSSKTRKMVDVVLTAAVTLWAFACLIAALDWDGALSGRAYALGALASAVTVAGLALNSRQVGDRVAVVAEKAPRDQYYRGYGDASEDALVEDPDSR